MMLGSMPCDVTSQKNTRDNAGIFCYLRYLGSERNLILNGHLFAA